MPSQVAEETDGTFTMTVDEIYADDTHGVVTNARRRRPWRPAPRVEGSRHLPPHAGGRIREFWGIPDDQEALDHFFND